MLHAANDVYKILDSNEEVEAVVFGDYGWGGYNEPEPHPVSKDRRGIVLSWEEAKPFMKGWSFDGGFGAPECYAVYIWTNQRVIWVTQYDGATNLDWAPRHPKNVYPDMPGG